MQAKTFLLDYFYENPSLNLIIPDNPLKLQDTLRKSLQGSRFHLLFNGINVLTSKMDALFFQIHTKFCKKSTKLSVIDILQLWLKTDPKFKITYKTQGQTPEPIRRVSSRPKNLTTQKSEFQASKSLGNHLKIKQKDLQNSLISPKVTSPKITNKVIQSLVSRYFSAVNKVKDQKDKRTIQVEIKELVSRFIEELCQERIPFGQVIYKIEEMIPDMEIDEQTRELMQQIVREYKRHPDDHGQHPEVILRSLLYEASSSDSYQRAVVQKTTTSFTNQSERMPMMTHHTMKITKKQAESTAKIRRLKLIFQSFSMANNNRKGLTFDQLTEEFKKMDLNNWMSFNKKYDTISKLGVEEVHMIFKRHSHTGVLDYPRFQKAFKDLSKQLFPEDITQAYSYFGLDNDGEMIIKNKIQLPTISRSRESMQLRQTNLNITRVLKNNKSVMQGSKWRGQNSFDSKLNPQTSSVQTSFRGLNTQVVSQLQNRIKKLKTKI